MKTKTCTTCKDTKGLDEFYKSKTGRFGTESRCKPCAADYYQEHKEERKIKDKSYYQKNKERVRSRNEGRMKRYYKENKESIDAKGREYYRKNKESIDAKVREYYRKNKGKVNARNNEWAKKNPDKIRAIGAKRRARIAGNGGSFTAKEWKKLCKKYKKRCVCCGEKEKLHADHVIPVSKGGTSDISNIQPLCEYCNKSKGNRHATDYR